MPEESTKPISMIACGEFDAFCDSGDMMPVAKITGVLSLGGLALRYFGTKEGTPEGDIKEAAAKFEGILPKEGLLPDIKDVLK